MKDLIIVATDLEIEPFLLRNGYKASTEHCNVYKFSSEIDFLFTGVGIPNTMLQLSCYCEKNEIRQVLQLGFAGSFDTDVRLGELVEVNQDCFGDLGIDDNGQFKPLHEVEGKMLMNMEQSDGWIVNPIKGRIMPGLSGNVNKVSSELRKVRGITVSTGSGSLERIDMLKAHWGADVESMEGAAAMLFCIHNDLKFRQVRCISNWVEPRDYSRWNTELAAKRLSDWLTLYIKSINEN